MGELKHLQPAQYASWLKKAHDPDWTEHRYRTAQDRAMVSAILDLESAETRVKELETQLEEEATADISINEVVEKYMRDFYVIKAENTALKSENERLEKQVARFLEPVSDEEVKKHFWKQDPTIWGIRITYAEGVNALIANRLEPKGRPINPPQEPS